MNIFVKILLSLFVPIISFAQAERYGTYGLYPHGSTRVMGMGGAFVGLSDDMGGIIYNPAGLARLKSWGEGGGNINSVYNLEADLDGGKKDGLPYYYLYYAGAIKVGNFAFGAGFSS